MELDRVHDLQRTFRKLVRAVSYPGNLESLAAEADKLGNNLTANPELLLLALTLLDAEVQFACPGAPQQITKLISHMTYSASTKLSEADFVFIDNNAENPSQLLSGMKTGDLINPHKGATAFLTVDALTEGAVNTVASSDTLVLGLSGPGISSENSVSGDRPNRKEPGRLVTMKQPASRHTWINTRISLNREFPLGIDMFIIDSAGKLLALPRSVHVQIMGN